MESIASEFGKEVLVMHVLVLMDGFNRDKHYYRTRLSHNSKISDIHVMFFPFCSVFLDGLKTKEELLADVYEDICQEIERLRGKSAKLATLKL